MDAIWSVVASLVTPMSKICRRWDGHIQFQARKVEQSKSRIITDITLSDAAIGPRWERQGSCCCAASLDWLSEFWAREKRRHIGMPPIKNLNYFNAPINAGDIFHTLAWTPEPEQRVDCRFRCRDVKCSLLLLRKMKPMLGFHTLHLGDRTCNQQLWNVLKPSKHLAPLWVIRSPVVRHHWVCTITIHLLPHLHACKHLEVINTTRLESYPSIQLSNYPMSSPEVLEAHLSRWPIGKLWGRSGWSFSMLGGAVVITHVIPVLVTKPAKFVSGSACLSILLATCKDLKPNPFGNPFDRILKGHGVRYHVFPLDQPWSEILLRRPTPRCPVSSFGKSLAVIFQNIVKCCQLIDSRISYPTTLVTNHQTRPRLTSCGSRYCSGHQCSSQGGKLAGLVPGCFIQQQATFHVDSTIFFGVCRFDLGG